MNVDTKGKFIVLLAAVIVLLFSKYANAGAIIGNVLYSGDKSGIIYVAAYLSVDIDGYPIGTPENVTLLSSGPSQFTIQQTGYMGLFPGLVDGNIYHIFAFMDLNSDMQPDLDIEPTGGLAMIYNNGILFRSDELISAGTIILGSSADRGSFTTTVTYSHGPSVDLYLTVYVDENRTQLVEYFAYVIGSAIEGSVNVTFDNRNPAEYYLTWYLDVGSNNPPPGKPGAEDMVFLSPTYPVIPMPGQQVDSGTIFIGPPQKGNINGDWSVNLKDAILALQQVISSTNFVQLNPLNSDVNADGKIGIEEAIYALQITTGMRKD